jgi:glycosyltransferase involved in cell wall biosynthesis
MREVIQDDWGVNPNKITVVPNGFFKDRINDARGTDPVEGRVCFLGTLHPKVDVEALAEIARLDAVSDLIVIGDGALRDRINKLTDEHEAVRATGRLSDRDAFEFVASASVVVNPQTQSELQRSSSPVKLFYYAALGKPMVVTAGPSIVEELVAADAAVASADRDAFVAAVKSVLESPDCRRTLASNARSKAKEYTWHNRIEQIRTVYADETGRHLRYEP